MTTDVDIYRGSSLESRMRYAETIAAARNLLPQGITNPAQALLIFEQASALGIPPITGLSQIHIISGKPTMSAGLMSGLIRQAGHKLRVWVEGEGEALVAKAELVRSDDPDFTFRASFSIDDAKNAGLYPGKPDSNWRKWPRSMVKARVTAEIAREGATDVFLGSIYTPEELNPNVEVDDHGELVNAPAPPRTNLTPETTESSTITPNTDEMPLEVRRQWFATAQGQTTYKALVAMYEDVKARGLLHITLADDPDNPDEIELGQYLIAKGKQAAAAEGVPPKGSPNVDQQTGEVDGEEDVVDAEVVEDEEPEPDPEPPMAMQGGDEPPNPVRARRTRKSAN